ncbi:MAG: hypothetical protein OES57_16370 [Acidimicrobiia bacterium]|nr:hypothetical protein [Acidimicrobiia bacterium]
MAGLLATAVGCASDGADEPSAESISATCGTIRDLHNELVEIANLMSERELVADPADRAQILDDGLHDLIERVRLADLPDAPTELVFGLEDRRAAVVDEMTANAVAFRSEWAEVSTDDRAAAVPTIFIWLEKLMSETQPAVTSDTPAVVIELVAAEPACDHVIR